jgi:hypothetical protein
LSLGDVRDRAGFLVVEARPEHLAGPGVGAFHDRLAVRIHRLQQVICQQVGATLSGDRSQGAGRRASCASRRAPFTLGVLGHWGHAWENRLVPRRGDDVARLPGVAVRQVRAVGCADHAGIGAVVAADHPGLPALRDRLRFQEARRHVDDQPQDLEHRHRCQQLADVVEVPIPVDPALLGLESVPHEFRELPARQLHVGPFRFGRTGFAQVAH